MSEAVWLILAGGLATYAIRWSGYAVVVRFKRLGPRVEAGMNAVPVAVLTAITAPAVAEGGVAEICALAAAALVTIYGNGTLAFLAGASVLILLRSFMG